MRGAGIFITAAGAAALREVRAAGLGAIGASGGGTIINSAGLGAGLTKTGHDQIRVAMNPT